MDSDDNQPITRRTRYPTNGMTRTPIPLRELAITPVVRVCFALLVFPFAISAIDSRLFSPLAVPGYVLFVIMTVVGNVLPWVRNFGFRLYWIPFIVVCYGFSLTVGISYYAIVGETRSNSNTVAESDRDTQQQSSFGTS